MSLLINLNQEGYENLKSDVEIVQSKIEELELIFSELNPSYKHLKQFYEPKVKIYIEKRRGEPHYRGGITIILPNHSKRILHSFKIDKIKNYTGVNDTELVKLSKLKVREFLVKKYPQYFE